LDIYQSLFERIDMRSFSNLWYWLTLPVLWAMLSHWVLGVPYDLILRARKQGGPLEADLRTMLRINATRLVQIMDSSGVWLVAFVCFGLSVLLILGFYYRVEFAQALVLILAPVALVSLQSLRVARRVLAAADAGAALFGMLRRHRIGVQATGLIAIWVTAMWGMYQNIQIGSLGP
jgi:hypothetical protein